MCLLGSRRVAQKCHCTCKCITTLFLVLFIIIFKKNINIRLFSTSFIVDFLSLLPRFLHEASLLSCTQIEQSSSQQNHPVLSLIFLAFMFKYLLFKSEVNFPLMEITPVHHDLSLSESFPLDAALPPFYPSLLPQLLLRQCLLHAIPLCRERAGSKID